MAFETYCVQHDEWCCGRPKGPAAHLGGLYWAVEYGGHPTDYRALQFWLERVAWHTVPYPEIPTFRGALTVGDVYRVPIYTPDSEAVARAVEQ